MALLGRQREVAALVSAVDHGARFIAVSGRAGVGKSAVLRAFAASITFR